MSKTWYDFNICDSLLIFYLPIKMWKFIHYKIVHHKIKCITMWYGHGHFFMIHLKSVYWHRELNLRILLFSIVQHNFKFNYLSNWLQSKTTDTNERFDMWVWICAKKVMIEVLKEAWRKILYSISNISSQLVFLILWWDFFKLQMTTVFNYSA